MGTDVQGWIEVFKFRQWRAVVDIEYLANRNYDVFGCLFGVRNYAGFRPVAAARGLPMDISDRACELYLTESESDDDPVHLHSETWVSWRDIKALDWEELAERDDERVHEYERDPSGEWVRMGGFLPDDEIRSRPEKVWEVGDKQYRFERLRRKDALQDSAWQHLFKMMASLAEEFGDDSVRMVVWFD